jgi:flagellar assembly protein FliH
MSSFSEIALPELRHGEWTRRGGSAVLGDDAAEGLLAELARTTRAAARAQGYAVGWAEGMQQAADRMAAAAARVAQRRTAEDDVRRSEHAAALDALGRAAEQVRGLLGDLAGAIEQQASELAFALTRELVGHEVRGATGSEVVARVLAVLPGRPVATVRLHPSVAGDAAAQDLVERGVEVVADPHLDRADALVESDGAVVDLRIAEALERVREVLR